MILIPLYSSGQKLVNSPLARFNLGTIEPVASYRSLGMGGTGIAMRDNLTINFANPASYSSVDTNSFIFDFGIDYGLNFISDGATSDLSEDLNFDHIILGFPIKRRWGFAAGLVPVSNGYYNIFEFMRAGDPGYDPITGEYTSFHEGSGSLTNFFLGTGFNLTKNISAGANMNLLFGSLKRTNEFDFSDYIYTFQTNSTETIRMRGIGFDLGLQYSASLKNDHFINLGLTWGISGKHKAGYDRITFRHNLYSIADTLEYVTTDSENASMPVSLKVGIAAGKKNKWNAGLDYQYTRWSEAFFPDSEGYLADVQTISAGLEYTPERFSNYNFMRRIDYRLGGHLGGNYLVLEGNPVKEFGMSIGAGVPIRRTYSKVNFFIDYTRRSVERSTYHHYEDYFTVGLSLNMYDIWFVKQKYN
jgi:hypothetical protein